MATRSLMVSLLAAAACSRSGGAGTTTEVHATTTIGPAGGVLAVDSGPQAGLALSAPAGALLAPTELSVVWPNEPLAVGAPTVSLSQPGTEFEIRRRGCGSKSWRRCGRPIASAASA